MVNYTMDDLKVLSETDLNFTISKSFSLEGDESSVQEETPSHRDFNQSKQLKISKSTENFRENYYKNLPGAMPISMKQILKAQNTNAPWLFNILKKKFHRSRKNKKERTKTTSSIFSAEEILDTPLSHDGTSGKWIVSETDILIKDFQTSTSGQFNVSHAMSSSTSTITNDPYDFQTSFPTNDQQTIPSIISEESEQNLFNDGDITSIASRIKTYYTTSRQQIESLDKMPSVSSFALSSVLEPIIEDVHLTTGNSTKQTTSKRAQSASATHSRSTKRGKRQSESTKKKKSKYYQEHFLSSEEIELREALRIIDLDNIGFFPPSELRKVLKEIGIHSHDIDKIERCLPLDEDGHYSIDNLVKLFLGTKET